MNGGKGGGGGGLFYIYIFIEWVRNRYEVEMIESTRLYKEKRER